MTVKKFSELTEEELDKIIDKHFSHWSQYSELMTLENTTYKFKELYAKNKDIPYGIALVDKDDIIGFCILKVEDLKLYPEYNPWISDVMIFDKYRGKGNGVKLINAAKDELNKLNYTKAYLWTDKAPAFYEKQGFKYIKEVLKNDKSGYGRLYSIDIKEN